MVKTQLHVTPKDGRWSLDVNGVHFDGWPQCRALRMALKTARAISTLPGQVAKVVVHEPDGTVRSVLSFGDGVPLRVRRKRRVSAPIEAWVPLALAARYARDSLGPQG